MILLKVPLLLLLICGIKFSDLQSDGGELVVPWVDTVQVPAQTPAPIAINSSQITPQNNMYNRFVTIVEKRTDTITNIGTGLVVTVGNDTGTYTSGGPLGLVNYIYHNIFFYWDLNLGPAAGTVDGVGQPLVAGVLFYNTNYTLADAINHRDGGAIFLMQINVSNSNPDNANFSLFANTVAEVVQNGTTANISGEALLWLEMKPVRNVEYCYPASLTNPQTRQIAFCTIVCVAQSIDSPAISMNQFRSTFGSLLNHSNKTYNNIKTVQKTSPGTPVIEVGPILISASTEHSDFH